MDGIAKTSDAVSPWAADFEAIDGVWLNSARHGQMPRVAAAASAEALGWKTAPQTMPDDATLTIPARLKAGLGRIVGAPAEQIVLGNSTSFGLQTIADALPWREGDEVLVVDGDFPATIYPWMPLAKRGVVVRLIRPRGAALDADDLAAALTPRTRLLCTNWVNSFTGQALDLDALGGLCRARDVLFIVNGAQATGARPIDVQAAPIDAYSSCGHKWLCGPYGTGFAWIAPRLLERMDCARAYYVPMQAGRDLATMRDYSLRDDLGAAAFDVFGSGHHLSFHPWAAAVDYIADQGVARIAAHVDGLVDRFIAGLDRDRFDLVSPAEGPARSSLIIASHREPGRNPEIAAHLTKHKVYISLREGNLRFSPHLANGAADIDQGLAALADGP